MGSIPNVTFPDMTFEVDLGVERQLSIYPNVTPKNAEESHILSEKVEKKLKSNLHLQLGFPTALGGIFILDNFFFKRLKGGSPVSVTCDSYRSSR